MAWVLLLLVGIVASARAADPLLTGTVIGTAGKVGNEGSKAFDGNDATYYEAATANDVWIGLDLGAGVAKQVTSISYRPLTGGSTEWRAMYHALQGCNEPTFTSGVVDLYFANDFAGSTITATVSNQHAFRYLRYLAPAGSYGQIAEVKFYGVDSAGGTVATPTFDLAAGAYAGNKTVSISCATTKALIRYTLDGTDPDLDSLPYDMPVVLRASATLKAKAFVGGMTASSTASAAYTITGGSGATVYLGTIQRAGANPNLDPWVVSSAIAVGKWGSLDTYATNTLPTGFSIAIPAASGKGVNYTARVDTMRVGLQDNASTCQRNTAGDIVATIGLALATGERGRIHVTWGSFPNNTRHGANAVATDSTNSQTFGYATYPEFRYDADYNSTPLQHRSVFEVISCASFEFRVADYNIWNQTGAAYVSAAWIEAQTAAPSLSQTGGDNVTSVQVTMTTASSGASIRYTTDGTTPTSSSTLYAAPVSLTLAQAANVKARTFKSGWRTSDTASGSFPVTPSATIAVTQNAAEPGTSGTYTVTLSAAAASATTVSYTVHAASTATSGTDYTALSGSLVIAQGNSTGTISVAPINDYTVESGGETVRVDLASGTGYALGATTTATMTVTDNDWAWNVNSNGNWSTAANWSPASVPNAVDADVLLGSVITAQRDITLDQNATVGNLVFNHFRTYRLINSGSNKLTIDASSGAAGIRFLYVGGVNNLILPKVLVLDDLEVQGITTGVNSIGDLGTTGGFEGASGITIRKTGSGTVTFAGDNSAFLGTMRSEAGAWAIAHSSSALGAGTFKYVKDYFNISTYGSDATISAPLVFDGALSRQIQPVNVATVRFTGAWSGSPDDVYFHNSPGSATGGIVLAGDNSGWIMTGRKVVLAGGGLVRLDHANALGTGNAHLVHLGFGSLSAASRSGLLTESSGLTVASALYAASPADSNGLGTRLLGTNHTTGTASFTGNLALNSNSGAIASTLSLQALGTSTATFSGVISSTGTVVALDKIGSGTVALTGTNTYSSTTSVSAGTLLANNTTGSGTGSGAVSVASGATLGGSGTVSGAISGAGTIAPGAAASLGTLSAGSTVNLSSGTLLTQVAAWTNPGSDYDRLAVTGALTLGGTSTLTVDLAGLNIAGSTRTITGIATCASLSGTFASVGVINNGSGYGVAVQYAATRVDLVITAAPVLAVTWDDGTTSAKTWALGSVGASSSASATWTILNAGSTPFNLSASGANSGDWTLATTAAMNAFSLKARAGTSGAYGLDLATGAKDVASLVVTGQTSSFGLQFTAPTYTTMASAQQTAVVTLTAVAQ
jgi:autotransporter-associated beta strand protein